MDFLKMYVFQIILVFDQKKEYQTRFGIYSTLEKAKEVAEENMLDEHGELITLECYIEKIEIDTIPKTKRQGIKICYINEDSAWEKYKNN